MTDKIQESVLICGLSGGCAGVFVDILYFPLETIKTRIQASRPNVDVTKKAANLKLYRGFSLQMFSSFPFAFIFFGTYNQVKRFLINNFQQLNPSLSHMISASFAEGLANSLRSPFEVAKQQQQAGWDKKITETLKKIYQSKGIRGFYVGFGMLLMRDIPFSAIQLPLYEKLNAMDLGNEKRDLTIFESCKNGAIAGSTAAFLTTPMDVIKTKLMTQRDNYYKDWFDCFKKVLKEEKVTGLFKGTLYRTPFLGMTGNIFFTVYEQCKILFNSTAERLANY